MASPPSPTIRSLIQEARHRRASKLAASSASKSRHSSLHSSASKPQHSSASKSQHSSASKPQHSSASKSQHSSASKPPHTPPSKSSHTQSSNSPISVPSTSPISPRSKSFNSPPSKSSYSPPSKSSYSPSSKSPYSPPSKTPQSAASKSPNAPASSLKCDSPAASKAARPSVSQSGCASARKPVRASVPVPVTDSASTSASAPTTSSLSRSASTSVTSSAASSLSSSMSRVAARRGDRKFTDCPQCFPNMPCMAAILLPCGHVTCRSCLSRMVHMKEPCARCGKSELPSPRAGQARTEGQNMLPPERRMARELAQQLGTDFVLQDLVKARVKEEEGETPCRACGQLPATQICSDCWAKTCQSCFQDHQHWYSTAEVSATSLSQPAHPSYAVSPGSTHVQRQEGHSAGRDAADNSQQIRRNIPNVMTSGQVTHPGPTSPTGTASSQTIQRPDKAAKSTSPDSKDWLHKQVQHLNSACSRLQQVTQSAQLFHQKLDSFVQGSKTIERILALYISRLAGADVTSGLDVVGLSSYDDEKKVRVSDFSRRLRHVREQCVDIEQTLDTMKAYADLKAALDKLAQPFPTPLTAIASSEQFDTDTTLAPYDSHSPDVTHVLLTRDGHYVMADAANQEIKALTSLSDLTTLRSYKMDCAPKSMALLSDGLVAVTGCKRVLLLDVREMRLSHSISTRRDYVNVVEGVDDDTLILGAPQRRPNTSGQLPATVDVIRRSGVLLKTLATSLTLPLLRAPGVMCVVGEHLLVPDALGRQVFKIHGRSGSLVEILRHAEVKMPVQVASNGRGDLFVVDGGSLCVMRWSSGVWQRLVSGKDVQNAAGNRWPRVVCVTESGLLVGWGRMRDQGMLLQGYTLV